MTQGKKQTASVEATVKKAVGLVVNGKSVSILNQLANVTEHLERHNYISSEEREDGFPVFMHHSDAELKKVRTQLTRALLEILKKPDELSYVQAFRIVVAIENINPTRKIPDANSKKIKFVKRFWFLCCSSLASLEQAMKDLAMLE